MKKLLPSFLPLAAVMLLTAFSPPASAQSTLKVKKGDHITIIGNTLADRMQHYPWLETAIHASHPEHNLTFRNLGFSGDEVKTRPRSMSFGSADEWMTKCKSDTVFCFFGYNEALKGDSALEGFKKDLAAMIAGMKAKKYNDKDAPQIVVFSPIAHENLKSPNLPDGIENNAKLEKYTAAMEQVCSESGVLFVDLFHPTKVLYAAQDRPLTMNGIHLNDFGYQQVASVIFKKLLPEKEFVEKPSEQLKEAVELKNYYWFSRYRVVDGYNVYGGRSKLNWHGQSNADVMKREMEIFDVMTENRDKNVWAAAKGETYVIKDDNIPKELDVKTNKPGNLPGGKWSYLSGEEAIDKMTIAKGMEVNLFADEKQFPRLINPVQVAVDTDSRLWVSVWPSYPHWNPTEKREDALLIFPDEDADGKADECIVFADELNSITGFEFWNGGVLVAAPPELWFLKDTDGDDKADIKIRMLQGISSADTHHSANAMVVGPDGWLYWSRGVFNIANFETPTKTYRSGQTGVHRFNPRTFEMEFHFPIGPNPHGDVIDQWGYQFVNDGTGGTGSYVNIGKGIGNKKWFKKRVRPVPATGILSSGHFPDEANGNFLICNAIGFLGVLQHEVKYNGADITAEEIEPIVFSSDPNFRPSDVEMGGDGALYISDWHNTLIGHMQHNMRDPNRDHDHGRIYRVTSKGRELMKPAKMKGKPIAEVCENFFAKGNAVRYRARLELSGRTPDAITKEVAAFADKLDPSKADANRDEAQALLECLWVFEEQRLANMPLLTKVFGAAEPKVRAAAIRTLGHWAGKVDDWQKLLLTAARDASPLVRAEAVKSAVNFDGVAAAEVIFEAATRPTDPELDTVIKYAKSKINVDALVKDSLKSGKKLSMAAQKYMLLNASVGDLTKLPPSEAVYSAILSRSNANPSQMTTALSGLAKETGKEKLPLLMGMIKEAQASNAKNLGNLGRLLADQPAETLRNASEQIETMVTKGDSPELKQFGYAAWIAATGGDDAYLFASKNKQSLRDFLGAIPYVKEDLRKPLFDKVLNLTSDLPSNLKSESSGSFGKPGIKVDYFYPSKSNVKRETLKAMKPKGSGIVPQIVMNVPQRKQADQFALRFTGNLNVPSSGKYTFYIASDDGSRIYLDGKSFIDHDGTHGMSEKSKSINLSAGAHKLMVTYFDNGGGDGLRVQWAGPNMKRQAIAAKYLSVGSATTIHDLAVETVGMIPGDAKAKFSKLSTLIAQGRSRPAAIKVLNDVKVDGLKPNQINPLVDNLIGYLSEMPAAMRTSTNAMNAVMLTRDLSKKLGRDQMRDIEDRLENLDVRVIAVGTIPHRMIYDKEMIVVQAGKPVEFRFSNTDAMPHNFAITKPGFLQEVGELGESTGRDKDAEERGYIPKSDAVLLGSRLIQPGETQALAFEVPKEPGVYPYVCTYPGHWRRMYGALYVVADLEAYRADNESYLADNPLDIKDDFLKRESRNREWKYAELVDDVKKMPMGRSFEVGKELFKVANCVACHKLNGEGNVFGPDIAKLDAKRLTPEVILRSIVEPSHEIEDKYRSQIFEMLSGKVLTGMVMEENDKEYKIVIDPLAKIRQPSWLKTISTFRKSLTSR